jgi:hypothetical protein
VNIHIPADFTLKELRAFIEGKAHEAPEGYYTACEWAEHFHIGLNLMRKLLRQAKERGLLRMIQVQREALDGTSYNAPMYALQGQNDISDSYDTM